MPSPRRSPAQSRWRAHVKRVVKAGGTFKDAAACWNSKTGATKSTPHCKHPKRFSTKRKSRKSRKTRSRSRSRSKSRSRSRSRSRSKSRSSSSHKKRRTHKRRYPRRHCVKYSYSPKRK